MRKISLSLFILFVASLSAHAQFPGGRSYRFRGPELKFQYIPYESKQTENCTHVLADERMQDWSVTCGTKKFTVHLWLTEYRRDAIPQLSMELLYWVSDHSRGGVSPQDTGTSLWFHFREATSFYSLAVKQGVDNDTAGLYLDIIPAAL
jgi:hypothetical protein